MRKYWIENLPGMAPLPICPPTYSRPDRLSAAFVEEGFFIEYFEYPFDRDRTVALFYGPREFIIPTHPVFSTVQALDRACAANFTYSMVFRTLRSFPETKFHYRELKLRHEKKVADRIKLACLHGDEVRFRFVLETQPWVFKQVPDNLLAAYLNVAVDRLRELKRDQKI